MKTLILNSAGLVPANVISKNSQPDYSSNSVSISRQKMLLPPELVHFTSTAKASVDCPVKIEPKIEIDQKILEDAKAQSEVEKQVIVHCRLRIKSWSTSIRIWQSTYLRDHDSAHKCRMLKAFNIGIYPDWLFIAGSNYAKFTLVFSALPKKCQLFDLFEDIPEPRGFYSLPISRNKSDVYSVEIYS